MIELALAFALVLCVGVICANFILLLSPIPFRGGLAGASMLATCGGSFSSHYWHYGANFSNVYFVPCIVGACAVVMIAALMSPPRSEFVHPH